MKTGTKIWLSVGAFLIVIGSIIFASVMHTLNWDLTKLSTTQYETNYHEISEDFHAISIQSDTADIQFVLAADAKCSVVCHEQQNAVHSVTIKDGSLVIEIIDSRKWHEYIGIHFGTPKITVYLPKTEYTALLIKESTGDIAVPEDFCFDRVDISLSTGDVRCLASASGLIKIATRTGSIIAENISAGALDLSSSTGNITVTQADCAGDIAVTVTTGKVSLNNIQCQNMISGGSTGDISMANVFAGEMLSAVRTTGDVQFDHCEATDVLIKTDTGDVTGTLLSGKIFTVQSDTGEISVPESVSGGKCQITTDTGDIRIAID